MKILSIQQTTDNLNINRRQRKQGSCNNSLRLQNCYPSYYYLTSFRGANIGKMYEEYNWYINQDKVPAIMSFLKISAPKEELDEFLTHILNTKDRSYELIDSIVSAPRETGNILRKLSEKVGVNSKNIMTFYPDSPYNKAYTNYIEEKYKRANTLSELLKIRPDWAGEALMKKYVSLTGNNHLKIGNIPKQIPKEHLEQILPYLKSKMEVGLKSRKEIDDLVIDGRTYKFIYYTEGKSSKNVFKIEVPAFMKKYVLKIDSPDKRSLDAPFALGTLAKIDKYLTANRSRNSAPLCYYDHEENYSIYKYIKHTHIDEPSNNLTIIKKHLPDFQALGLDYNYTVGYKNFFKLNEHSIDTHYHMEGFDEAVHQNEWISVDNDHVTYSNRFNPNVNGYHKALPNAMGMFF